MKKALLWGVAICAMLIFLGCRDEPPDDEDETPQPFTLTVTDIPSVVPNMMGAGLMNLSDIYTVIATGMETGSPGIFSFYLPGTDRMMPSTTPFNEPGQYVIQLAEVSLSGADIQIQKVYMYMGAANQPTTFSFPAQQSIPWTLFQQVPYPQP